MGEAFEGFWRGLRVREDEVVLRLRAKRDVKACQTGKRPFMMEENSIKTFQSSGRHYLLRYI